MNSPHQQGTTRVSVPHEAHLSAHLTSVRDARRFVDRHCAAYGVGDDLRETAVLLTSEIVTNAVLHGRSGAQLLVSIEHDVLRVEVTDDNTRLPQRVSPDAHALDGRGLVIVETLATAWGAAPSGQGKRVWFELRLAQA
jgi:anti-sigma regulatory factor (Ser/Thr protein kinase)